MPGPTMTRCPGCGGEFVRAHPGEWTVECEKGHTYKVDTIVLGEGDDWTLILGRRVGPCAA